MEEGINRKGSKSKSCISYLLGWLLSKKQKTEQKINVAEDMENLESLCIVECKMEPLWKTV